jgi:hypothetical protein
MNQIESDANKYIPFSDDALDELISKRIHFEDEILSQLKNLNVYNDTCTEIYKQIVENINSLTYFPETHDVHDATHFFDEKTDDAHKLTTQEKNLSLVNYETYDHKTHEGKLKKEDLRKLRLRFYSK